jgi:DNA-binding transcriptional ArsR family regulator
VNTSPAHPDSDRVYVLAAELFGLLSAPVRLKIVCALREGELSVSQLQALVQATQPNLSQHLATLYRSGVLLRRRVGSQVRYSIASEQVAQLCHALQTELAQAAAPFDEPPPSP